MARGPIITDEVRVIITEVYMDHPEWRAKQVQREVNKRLDGKGPKLSAIQKHLTKQRKSYAVTPKTLEAPWSLGVSATYNIPPEANQDLIKIWKWCIVVGLTLTIREAQWVSRLRELVPYRWLYAFAIEYAKREQACQLSGFTGTVTADLDFRVAFYRSLYLGATRELEDIWLSITASYLDVIGGILPKSELKRDISSDYQDKEYLAERTSIAGYTVEEYLGLQPSHAQVFSENVEMIYSMWLRLFSKGPNWQKMSETAKNNIAKRLYEEVGSADKEYEYLLNLYRNGETPPSGCREGWSMALIDAGKWKPSQELFDEVGITKSEQYISVEEEGWTLANYESEQVSKKLLP